MAAEQQCYWCGFMATEALSISDWRGMALCCSGFTSVLRNTRHSINILYVSL